MSRNAIPLLTLAVTLTGAVSQSRFVTPAGAQAGAGANTLGVARTDGAIGEKVPCEVLGTATVETGGAIAAGATIGSDATGRAVTYASGAKVAVLAPGEVATAAGQFVEVILIPNAA